MDRDDELRKFQAEFASEIDRLSERVTQLEEENVALKESIKSNYKLFGALLRNGRDGIALTGPDRRIVRVIRGLTGIDPNSLSGSLIDSLTVPEDSQIVVEAYRQLLENRCTRVEIVARFAGLDGEPVTYAVTLTDMLDDPDVRGIVWNYSASAALPTGQH